MNILSYLWNSKIKIKNMFFPNLKSKKIFSLKLIIAS